MIYFVIPGIKKRLAERGCRGDDMHTKVQLLIHLSTSHIIQQAFINCWRMIIQIISRLNMKNVSWVWTNLRFRSAAVAVQLHHCLEHFSPQLLTIRNVVFMGEKMHKCSIQMIFNLFPYPS